MINTGAMGIIFPNLHDESLPELLGHRTMASLPFAGRYRMIDFVLSGMASAGMTNVGVVAQKNYASLMDHVGNGREWDLTRKRGGLVIFPPYARSHGEVHANRVEMLASVMEYLVSRKEELLVMSDCNVAANLDYVDIVKKHREQGADITVVYNKEEFTDAICKDNVTFNFGEEGFATSVRVNEYKKGVHNVAMNVYVVGREYMITVVREALVRGEVRFAQDFLAKNLKKEKVYGYEHKGYAARICDMNSYFAQSMRLLDINSLSKLFPTDRPIYTKVRDEAPVRYAIGSRVKKSIVADGCIIEGSIENCILFRGVHVAKGAKLKNCVVMQGTDISEDVTMENVITDKNVNVCGGQSITGAASFPVFIAKGCTVN